jgi:iron complex transport system substrate-binding protein
VRQAGRQGDIADVGENTSLNYEKILSLSPDLVLAFGVDAGSARYIERMQELGLRVMVVPEYLEETALGKAEWIKVFALLFGQSEKAEEVFSQSKKRYKELKTLAAETVERPVVCVSLPWKDTWWVPGGRSLTAQLISDAGGKYLWGDNTSREAIGLSLESAWLKARTADVWVNAGAANSLDDILSVEKRLKELPVFKSGYVYNNNARRIPGGGVDYWESGVVRPDLILKDLIQIFHPDLLQDTGLYYYHKLY